MGLKEVQDRDRRGNTDPADSEMIGSILLISMMAVAVAIIMVVLVSQPIAEKIPNIEPNVTMYTIGSGTTYFIITHAGGDSLQQSSSTIWNSDGIVDPSFIIIRLADGSESPWPGKTWSIGSSLLVPSGSSDTETIGIVYHGGSGQHLLFRQGAGPETLSVLKAAFRFSPNPAIVSQEVRFTDYSTGAPTNWSWNFGDGQTSNLQNPSHIFQSTGVYSVTLTVAVANTGVSSTVTQTITVYAVPTPPQVSFIADPLSGMAPLTVQFTDTSTGTPTSWFWNFGDDSRVSSQNSTHTFQSAGTYVVTLTAANAFGSGTVTQIITVTPCILPQAAFQASPQSGDAPLTVQFVDTSTGSPINWSWTFGNEGTSISRNATHTFNAAGSYPVNLTVANACGQSTSSQTITVTSCPVPQATFTVDKNSGPVPLSVQFTDASTGSPTNWSWNFGDGTTSAEPSPTHIYTREGMYPVNLTASNSCGQTTITQAISVTACPVPRAFFSFAPPTGIAPLSVQFTDTSTGSPTRWSWDFGDNTPGSSLQNPSHTFTNPSNYLVSLTVFNICGQNTSYQTVEVHPPIVADFDYSPITGNAPLNVQFIDRSTGLPTTWSWNFGDNSPLSTLQNPSHTFTMPGTYMVTLTVGNSYSSGTVSHRVTVTAPPTPTPTPSPTGGNVYLNTEKVGYIEQGGYMQFRVTGGNPSYIKIGNTRIEFKNGDTVKLVVGSDGSGKIFMNSGMISTFQFNGVSMYINGVFASSGNVNDIYVGNHDSFVSTMTITTSSQTKWTDLKVNGNQIVHGDYSPAIRVFNIAPDSSRILNLDTLSPGSSKVYFVGSATSVTY